jgi:hypothetical protein
MSEESIKRDEADDAFYAALIASPKSTSGKIDWDHIMALRRDPGAPAQKAAREKVPPESVGYVDKSPFADQNCKNCGMSHFAIERARGDCDLVDIDISRGGWCQKWITRP